MPEHNEKDERTLFERDEENREETPECLFHNRPCCPLTSLSLFWRVTIVATAILMLILVFTMYSLTMAFNRYAVSLEAAKTAILVVVGKVGEKVVHVEDTVNQHKQLTMENRVVQSETRGILTGWIEESRRLSQQIQQVLERMRK